MGLFDALRGRSTPPPADLDVLFAVPQAVLSLEVQGYTATGIGAVCYRDAEGSADDAAVAEARELVSLDSTAQVATTTDSYGFTWVTVTRSGDVPGLVTDLHAVNSNLVDAGFSSALLCSIVGLRTPAGAPLLLVYLFKQGTFYPFAPQDGQRRDNPTELAVRGVIADDVQVEADLSRWLALWGAPGTT